MQILYDKDDDCKEYNFVISVALILLSFRVIQWTTLCESAVGCKVLQLILCHNLHMVLYNGFRLFLAYSLSYQTVLLSFF
jgi:hypothetical protein